jgi:lysophospholipase L1-like esterase
MARIRVLLLGDSTLIGSVPREMIPTADTLEEIVRKLLAGEAGLPPAEVVNRGRDGDSIDCLLSRLDEDDATGQAPFDFIFIRYGLNDICVLKDFKSEFPVGFKKLISRLRADHPQAEIVPETVIPYVGENPVFARDPHKTINTINKQVRAVAAAEELPLLDQYGPYAEELKRGPYMLSYRRLGLAAIPAKFHALIPPEWIRNEPPTGNPVAYMFNNLLDVHLAEIPGWFQNRHPNPAGYQVIGAQLAEYLARRLRERANALK